MTGCEHMVFGIIMWVEDFQLELTFYYHFCCRDSFIVSHMVTFASLPDTILDSDRNTRETLCFLMSFNDTAGVNLGSFSAEVYHTFLRPPKLVTLVIDVRPTFSFMVMVMPAQKNRVEEIVSN